MAQQDGQVHKVLGSEALGILFGRWRDGTFSGIADDWRWICGVYEALPLGRWRCISCWAWRSHR